jgi:autotransporter-associated beta strand protein
MDFAGTVTTTTNTYNLDGGILTIPAIKSTVTNGAARVFNFGGGTLTAAGSSATFLNLGAGNATANVRNGGAIINNNGYAITIAQPLVHSTIGGDAATDGGLTASGAGALTLTGVNTYTGPTTLSAGELAITSGGTLGASSSAVNLSGGTLDLGGQTSTNGNFTMAGGTIQNGTLSATNYSLTSGTVAATLADGTAGPSPLSLSGTGTVTFTTNQTFTGTTALNGATLALGTGGTLASTNINLGASASQGTLSIAASAYTLASNQTLAGYGTVNIGAGAGTLTANGTITNGGSTAILHVAGSLTLGSTATTALTITAPGIAGTAYDAVQLTNALTYNGTLDIVYSGVTAPIGTFNLFSAGSFVTSDFNSVVLVGTWSPSSFVSQGNGVWIDTAGGGSTILTFTGPTGNLTVSAVPEPSTWALLSLALIGGLVARRKLLRQKERSA